MLTTMTESEERITTAHRAKLAYVYIRQSSAGQVRQHQESTQLQYRLVGRAASLGWPRDRIEVIDDDLGKSGASSDARYGFQRLIAEIGLGKAGLVLSLDASRLARNNCDWHQLLELCSLFGALIADGERLYDPCVYHDCLLLGLSGIMGAPVCQEVRALPVDSEVERLVLEALEPDRIAMAITALAQVKEEVRQLERQWSLKKERAYYEAERARRQYDAVDPDNRLVARSLERQWEEKLREVEATELAFQRWRSQQSLDLSEGDREALLTMGEDMPKIWHAPTTTAADRKQMLRFLIRDVMLDQKREQGQVVIKIVWATGASSEHRLRRKVQAYDRYAGLADLERRVRELNSESKMDAEIAEVLNREEYKTTRGTPFSGELVHLLRQRWAIPTVKINGTQPNPARWPDGSYSVQGLAVAMGVTAQTIFKFLRRGRLNGRQLTKGMPWQIDVAEKQIADLKGQVQRKSRSRMGAS